MQRSTASFCRRPDHTGIQLEIHRQPDPASGFSPDGIVL